MIKEGTIYDIETEEEKTKDKQMEEDIIEFVNEVDRIWRVRRSLPALKIDKFDPLLFMIWKNGRNK
jgi:hypothetical protein